MVWVTVIAPVFLLETAQPIEPLADQLLSGELDPVTYDYGAIRFEAGDEVSGWERLGALERAVSLQVAPENVREGARLDIEQAGCEPPLHGRINDVMAEGKPGTHRQPIDRIDHLSGTRWYGTVCALIHMSPGPACW